MEVFSPTEKITSIVIGDEKVVDLDINDDWAITTVEYESPPRVVEKIRKFVVTFEKYYNNN